MHLPGENLSIALKEQEQWRVGGSEYVVFVRAFVVVVAVVVTATYSYDEWNKTVRKYL